MDTILLQQVENGSLRPIDMHAGRLIYRMSKNVIASLAAAFISNASGNGHVCLPLEELSRLLVHVHHEPLSIKAIREQLTNSSVVGSHGDIKPLIMAESDLIYLYKYYQLEEQVAEHILYRSNKTEQIDLQVAASTLQGLFKIRDNKLDPSYVDWQHIATAMSLLKPLLVVSGGPGTGKTYTVARIIAALTTYFPESKRVCLAAPTGKAATRLKESLQEAKKSLPAKYANSIPDEASTIHRLFKFNPHTRKFGYNRKNRLPVDVLIIDEASMIDIVLMAVILDGLHDHCRLILLGDKNQLASVEAGNLFGDICGDQPPQWSGELQEKIKILTKQPIELNSNPEGEEDSILLLQKSFRFHETSGIGRLASGVNDQNMNLLTDCLNNSFEDLSISIQEEISLPNIVTSFTLANFSTHFDLSTPQEALSLFEQSRILCATRKGEAGVKQINQQVELNLAAKGLIEKRTSYYKGQPVMILVNDYSLELYNGDIGMIWPDGQGQLYCWFTGPDTTMRPVSITSLPEHQTCYAMTVHKSQGSEFDQVLFILPKDDSPLLTKELLYTAITRAKKHLSLCTSLERFMSTAKKRSIRFSGLYTKLRQRSIQMQ